MHQAEIIIEEIFELETNQHSLFQGFRQDAPSWQFVIEMLSDFVLRRVFYFLSHKPVFFFFFGFYYF